MPDNETTGSGKAVATKKATVGGDTDQNVQLIERIRLAGAEGSWTPIPEYEASELSLTERLTSLRDLMVAERYTTPANDSLADGLAGFWTSTTANGGTATSTGGEGVVQTSANANGSAQIVGSTVAYFPGQVSWFNSAVRFNATLTNNTRRIGVFTVSGTTPQNGFYYELSGATLNAVVCNGGTPTAVASTSWTNVTNAPFTLDTNYHSFEINYTANEVLFYIDKVLRHRVAGTNAAITATLNFPITIQSINASAAATNALIAVRNCGVGRFGNPFVPVTETGLNASLAVGVGGATPHDSVDSGNPLKIGGYASAAAPTSVSADGDRVNSWFLRNGAQATVVTAAGALIGGDATNGLDVDVTRTGEGLADDAAFTVGTSRVIPAGLQAVAHGSNPDAADALDAVVGIANRHRVQFTIGGHPNSVTIEQATTGSQTDVAVVTISTGTKIVVTQAQFITDNANTAFPQARLGFGTANTPTTTGVVLTHPGLPAGGGVSRGDGSGIIGIGADNEDLRITNGAPTGGSLRTLVTYHTIDS